MVDAIHIEVEDAVDGRDLIETLARRGVIGELVASEDHWEVELWSAREKPRRLLLDVEPVLRLWLSDRQRASIPLRIGERNLLEPRARSNIGELPAACGDGGPHVRVVSRRSREKGESHGSDREMEPVA